VVWSRVQNEITALAQSLKFPSTLAIPSAYPVLFELMTTTIAFGASVWLFNCASSL
jgi:hypothetical protein